MKVLAINCGSSTLKFQVIKLDEKKKTLPKPEQKLAGGRVEGIGSRGGIKFIAKNGENLSKDIRVDDHQEEIKLVFRF